MKFMLIFFVYSIALSALFLSAGGVSWGTSDCAGVAMGTVLFSMFLAGVTQAVTDWR